jgi:hypothetical protein
MFSIALDVAGDLIPPVLLIASRHPAPSTAVPVPEAAVDENGELQSSERDVGITRDVLNVRLEPQASGMQCLGNSKFRRCAFRQYLTHNPTALFSVEAVRHCSATFLGMII